MSLKKQIIIFLSACFLFASLFVIFNVIVDPFGVFGDKFFAYYEYNMTSNPRVAKIAYIDKHGDEYDSYIFGCSKSSSYPIDELNEYLDARFFNMFAYGGDLYDIERMATYVIETQAPKNLVLAIGPEAAYSFNTEEDALKDNLHEKTDANINPLVFYGKYLFLNPAYSLEKIGSYFGRSYIPKSTEVFTAETGAYNKKLRDIMPISDIDSYYRDMADSDFDITHYRPMNYIDEAVEAVENIKKMCDERGINFILIGSPMYDSEIACYDSAQMSELTYKLAEVTDFYNFWGYNAFSHDARYFYDGYHFRNAVGSAALGYIFGNEEIFIPDSFGRVTTSETVDHDLAEMSNTEAGKDEMLETHLPILMYHAFTTNEDDETNPYIISEKAFDSQMSALKSQGYTSVTFHDIENYVFFGVPLPEKPIVLTFDDGYTSNLEIAAPILEKYGFSATVSVVGSSIGRDTHKVTGAPILPHFSLEEALPYVEKGVIDIQPHSFDMHGTKADGYYRDAMLKKDGESEEEYIKELRRDFSAVKTQIESVLGSRVFVMTYPHGFFTPLTDIILSEEGATVSLSTIAETNKIMKGLPQTLRGLRRFNITGFVTAEELLNFIEN